MLKLPARPLSTSAFTVVTWTVSKKLGLSIWSPASVVGNTVKGVGLLVPVGDPGKYHRPAVALNVRHRGHQGEWRGIDVHEGSGWILLSCIEFFAEGTESV